MLQRLATIVEQSQVEGASHRLLTSYCSTKTDAIVEGFSESSNKFFLINIYSGNMFFMLYPMNTTHRTVNSSIENVVNL